MKKDIPENPTAPTAVSLEEHAHILAMMVRRSLLEVNLSPDAHLEDIDRNYLQDYKNTPAGKVLLRVLDHMDTLYPDEREIFVKDILETGRHYRFWYFDRRTRKEEKEMTDKLSGWCKKENEKHRR